MLHDFLLSNLLFFFYYCLLVQQRFHPGLTQNIEKVKRDETQYREKIQKQEEQAQSYV